MFAFQSIWYKNGPIPFKLTTTYIVFSSCEQKCTVKSYFCKKALPGLGARPYTALIRPFGSHTGGVGKPKYMVWETLESHDGLDNGRTTVWSEGKVWEMVWTMVALRSDQRAKSHYSLIIDRTKVWTMVALRTDPRAKSHYSLIIDRTKVWTIVPLRSDQRPKSGHKLPQNLTTEH